jgi:hypothetical protein
MKIIGNGGTVDKDGSPIANVTSFDFDETEGDIYGQKQCDVTIETIADSAALPLRHGDVYDLVLTVSGSAAWDITITDAEVIAASIGVSINNKVTQTLTLKSKQRAVIA